MAINQAINPPTTMTTIHMELTTLYNALTNQNRLVRQRSAKDGFWVVLTSPSGPEVSFRGLGLVGGGGCTVFRMRGFWSSCFLSLGCDIAEFRFVLPSASSIVQKVVMDGKNTTNIKDHDSVCLRDITVVSPYLYHLIWWKWTNVLLTKKPNTQDHKTT